MWHHEVDPTWLEARRHVLTATDIVNLLPEYKRWVKAKDPDALPPGFSALWCQKATEGFDEVDSWNAAARGHVMEPYAIEDWNMQCLPIFEHWDDCIIVRNGVGFSPDAMTIPQYQVFPALQVSKDGNMLYRSDKKFEQPSPAMIMEVKCYEPANHMKALCVKDKLDHKEAWQIATAFYVLPKLMEAKLLWYCPNAPFPMHVESYTRVELKDMIDTICKIVELYDKVDNHWEAILKGSDPVMEAHFDEQGIYDEFVASQQPDSVFELR